MLPSYLITSELSPGNKHGLRGDREKWMVGDSLTTMGKFLSALEGQK